MDWDEIAIATMTRARTNAEGKILYEAIKHLSHFRIPIFVADGGSIKNFVNDMIHLPNVICGSVESNSLIDQMKWSLGAAEASGKPYVLYTEPDKRWFFEHQLEEFLRSASPKKGAGIIIPSRSNASFITFPKFQQYTESVANRLCSEVIYQSGDFVYGPILIDRNLVSSIEQIKQDIGWGWRFFTIAFCYLAGRAVDQITLELPCPPDQRAEDTRQDRLYRMEQLAQNLQGLTHAVKAISNREIQ